MMKYYAWPLIRFSVVLLFLWFGVQQLLEPSAWIGYLPEWTGYLPIPGEMLVSLNGWFEIITALLLGAGCYTRLTSSILAVHLLGIAWVAGGAVGMRDLTLGLCMLALAMSDPDQWTLDYRVTKKGMAQ